MNEVTDAVGAPGVAVLAGTTPAGARKALERLEAAGFVDRVGVGHAPKYRVRDSAVGRRQLAGLFEAEQKYYDELVDGLRAAVAFPEILSAWYEPLPANRESAIHLVVTVGARDVAWVRDEIRSRLAPTEKRFDVIVEVAVYTRADEVHIGLSDVALWGVVTPGTSAEGPGTHAEATARSLRLAQSIARLVRTDPTIIRRAQQHLDRLLAEDQGMAPADLTEWRQLLQAYSAERLADLLVSTSSRGERLRRSAPFIAVLTPEERDLVLGGSDEGR